jgi:hypothetical protein
MADQAVMTEDCCMCTGYNEDSICLGHMNHGKPETQTSYFVAPGIQAVFASLPGRHRNEVNTVIKSRKKKSVKELQRQVFTNAAYNHSEFVAFVRYDARGYLQLVSAVQAKIYIISLNKDQKLANLAGGIPEEMWSYHSYMGQLRSVVDKAAAGGSNVVAGVGRQTDSAIRSSCTSIKSVIWRQLPKLVTPKALEEHNERILARESSQMKGHMAAVNGLSPLINYPYLALRATATSLHANLSLVPQPADGVADSAETGTGVKKRRSSASFSS